ncbi:MAG: YbaY family lipoprotein [Pirellula sp.]|jgi:uncharacterized lipoprotein YbaY|nr:YbaY family lipoprotein [Pirellula sp.]
MSCIQRILLSITACIVFGENSLAQNWADMFAGALPRSSSSFGGSNPNIGASTSYPGFGSNPSLTTARRDWKLGVGIQNNDVGAVVTTVAPGSPAQLSGINQGDVIVAAGAARLGMVENRIVELAEEIKRYADSYGRINLVVLDSRTRTLRSLNVTMTSSSSAISGQVVFRDGAMAPTGAVLAMQLQNISRPFFEVAGGRTSIPLQGYGPFRFELNVDPRFIDPSDQYDLSMAVMIGNQVLYNLITPIRLNSSTLGQPLNVVLERSMSTTSSSVTASYPSFTNPADDITRVFQQLTGQPPTVLELVGWQAYLQQGNSIDGLRAAILGNVKYRSRFPDDVSYMQSVLMQLTNRQPNQSEISFWVGRLRSTGSPDIVIREIMEQRR